LVGTILASALGSVLAVATLLDLAAILFGVAGLVALVLLPETGRPAGKDDAAIAITPHDVNEDDPREELLHHGERDALGRGPAE
jgi:hypothetical protein